VYVVDASVWVSRFLPDDVHHQTSRRWFEDVIVRGDPLVSPALVLPEIAGALGRRTGDAELALRAVSLLQLLPSLRLVPIDGRLADAAARVASTARLRGADSVYVALAEELGLPLVTWDREQLERTVNRATAVTPDHVTR